jgi:hypothetical protein
MSDNTPSASDGGSDAPETPTTPPRRGAHRAPAKPQRVIVVGLIAVAAVVALLVAFGACGGGFDSGAGVINGTPGVTTPPATSLLPSTTAPATTAPPTTAAPTTAPPTTAPPTTRPRTTPPRTTAAATPTRTAAPTTAPPTSGPKLPVDVFNGSNVPGLAREGATQVRAAGWAVAAVGNWRRTTVTTETVFFGPGDEGSARRLARELPGAQQVGAALPGMSTSRLTYVVLP